MPASRETPLPTPAAAAATRLRPITKVVRRKIPFVNCDLMRSRSPSFIPSSPPTSQGPRRRTSGGGEKLREGEYRRKTGGRHCADGGRTLSLSLTRTDGRTGPDRVGRRLMRQASGFVLFENACPRLRPRPAFGSVSRRALLKGRGRGRAQWSSREITFSVNSS